MKVSKRRLKNVSRIRASNVDKKSVEGDVPVRLCNYVDVYKNRRITDDLPFMSASATRAQVADFGLRAGDILVTKDSETPDDIGVPAYVPDDLDGVVCGYHLAIIRPDTSILDPAYLAWVLQSEPIRDYFTGRAKGVTRFALGYSELGDAPVPVPAFEKQRAIERFLDEETSKIDTLIEKKQQLLSLLWEHRIVRGRHVLFQGIHDIDLVDSGVEWLGEIAAGWTLRRAGALFRERDERGEPNLPLLEVSLNRGVTIREFSEDRIERVAANLAQQKIARRGDLVFNKMRMWQGAVGVAPEDGLVSTDYTVAKPMVDIDSFYFAQILRTSRAKVEIDKWSHGMVRDRNRLYWDGFKRIQLPIPSLVEQHEIVRWLDNRARESMAVESRIKGAIEKLDEYRAALIRGAVTGQIDVQGAA